MATKRKAFAAMLLLFALILTSASGEGLIETEGRIVGRMEAPTTEGIDVDMPIPQSPPAVMSKYTLGRVRLEKERIQALLTLYGMPPAHGEQWVMDVGSKINPDFELIYREETGRYGSVSYDEMSPAVSLDISNPRLCAASDTVKSFMDELGIAYEYPFFQVKPLEQGLIEVVVRLTIDGIPCHTSIGWTKDSDGGGNGDPTPSAFFIVSEDGKLTTAVIRNPVTMIEQCDDAAPVMDWQLSLTDDLPQVMRFFGGENASLTLHAAELVMMVDARQRAYPAWAYFFTRAVQSDEFNATPYSYDMALVYDARTGECVWRQ